ncbi:MAG: hypothetical protein GY841_10665 [FCB group bacterium]|nr:hypothetical protein [FCB group bacterium]
MGRVGNILGIGQNAAEGDHTTDIKLDIGGGQNITAPQATPAGIDSTPLETDIAVTSSAPGDSGQNVVGYVDKKNASKNDGVYLYARSAAGVPVADIWIKTDGSVVVTNTTTTIETSAAGNIEISNAVGSFVIDPIGNITIGSGLGSITMTPAGIVSINNKLTVLP